MATSVRENTRTERTHEDLRQIARDLINGHIMSSLIIRDRFGQLDVPRLVRVFPCLALMDDETFERLQKKQPGLFFEYVDKAHGWVNGDPMFFTMQVLTEEEVATMLKESQKMLRAQEATTMRRLAEWVLGGFRG